MFGRRDQGSFSGGKSRTIDAQGRKVAIDAQERKSESSMETQFKNHVQQL